MYHVTFQESISIVQTAKNLQGNYLDENSSQENVHLFRIEAYALRFLPYCRKLHIYVCSFIKN